MCNHFDVFVYGRDRVNVETDHKPLEQQRMFFVATEIRTISKTQGKDTTDKLTRAHYSEVHSCEFATSLEDMDQ